MKKYISEPLAGELPTELLQWVMSIFVTTQKDKIKSQNG